MHWAGMAGMAEKHKHAGTHLKLQQLGGQRLAPGVTAAPGQAPGMVPPLATAASCLTHQTQATGRHRDLHRPAYGPAGQTAEKSAEQAA